MSVFQKRVAFGIGLLTAIAGGLTLLGSKRWTMATQALVEQLDKADVKAVGLRYSAGRLIGLPSPVERYFKRVLTDGQPMIRSVDLKMNGTFNLNLDSPTWRSFRSYQHVVIDRPGFVWNAKIMVLPGVAVLVHDAYVNRQGLLRPSLCGLFSLGTIKGTGDIARGELMRWFAEAVWYPTALLPGPGVRWAAVDANHALATITDGPVTLPIMFRFGEDGLISGFRVDARGALINGQTVMMPWQGDFHDYRRVNGMMIPFRGEVGWITPHGEQPYFKGRVEHVNYIFS